MQLADLFCMDPAKYWGQSFGEWLAFLVPYPHVGLPLKADYLPPLLIFDLFGWIHGSFSNGCLFTSDALPVKSKHTNWCRWVGGFALGDANGKDPSPPTFISRKSQLCESLLVSGIVCLGVECSFGVCSTTVYSPPPQLNK